MNASARHEDLELRAWVLARTGADRIVGVDATGLTGGAVSDAVARVRFRVDTGAEISVVIKTAASAEIAGLLHAQMVRDDRGVIPELIAAGTDWVAVPFAAGRPLGDAELPNDVVRALARLHAGYLSDPPSGVPVVTDVWWRRMLLDWGVPFVRNSRTLASPTMTDEAVRLMTAAAEHPAVSRILSGIPVTLVHGDVHGGNVLVGEDGSRLIDWGSARVGPAMLDLMNAPDPDGAVLAAYRKARADAGAPLTSVEEVAGAFWARVQIAVQYLPWVVTHEPAERAAVALDRAAEALDALDHFV